jgi:hypothetical protein
MNSRVTISTTLHITILTDIHRKPGVGISDDTLLLIGSSASIAMSSGYSMGGSS